MEEFVGRKVVGFDWRNHNDNNLGWMGEMEETIGKIGTIAEYDSYDHSFRIDFKDDLEDYIIYWHPADMALNYLVEKEPSQLDQLTNLFYNLLDTLERDNTIPNEIVITNKELFLKTWRREIKKIVSKD